VSKSSQLVMPERERPVAPFDIGAGALEDLGKLGRLLLQPALLERKQRTARPTRGTQGCTEALSKLPQWGPFPDQLGGSDTCEIVRRDEKRLHGVGRWLRQGQLTDVLPHSLGGNLDRRWHCGHHALRLREALPADLAEAFLMGDAADGVARAL